VGTATVALGASSLAVADGGDGGLTAAVGGISDPASGVLNVEVQARAAQGRLASTAVDVDGAAVASAGLCPPDSTSGCQAEHATMPLDTQALADGEHHVVVTVTDADGHTIDAVDRDFDVLNHPPAGSPTATMNVGAGAATPQGGSVSGAGVEGASAVSCTTPQLSMSLAQRPLRVSRGVPVLSKGKRYRFSGRLTCVTGGKRRSAPRGTRVSRVDVIHGRRVRRSSAVVGNGGRIATSFSLPSSRAVEFGATTAGGKASKVRIRVLVQRKRKG
jgi:hypothetical protein